MILRSLFLCLLTALVVGCPGDDPEPPPPLDEIDPEGDLAACGLLPEPVGWDHIRTEGIVLLGEPVHSVQDAIVAPGEAPVIRAKLSYGTTSVDLEDERVEAWIQLGETCAGWTRIGDALTDTDGRVAIPSELALEVGVYPVMVVAQGDASTAFGFVYVLAEAQPLVVFDIDGTLTTSDVELIDGVVVHHVGTVSESIYELAGSPLTRAEWLAILDRTLDPEASMHEGADDVVWWYAEHGIQPVYITGRPYLYDGMTREWLAHRGFPAGPLVLVQDVLEALPELVDDYKERTLLELLDRGLPIAAAYGNALTDVCAYARAGIDPAETFIIGSNAGAACEGYAPTVPIESYVEQLATLE